MWKHCLLILGIIPVLIACNANSSKNQYELAERLFMEAKYEASIHEFRKIVKKDPKSSLGIEALYRVGTIQRLYLRKPKLAIQSYKALISRSTDPQLVRKVRETIAEMYFSDFNNFGQAILYYQALVKDESTQNKKRDYFLYRLGRGMFLKGRFEEALKVFSEIETKYKFGEYYEKAMLAKADTLNSSGNCKEAIKTYELLSEKAQKNIKSLAIFGMANCYEELDNLDKAYDLLATIQNTYTTPHVIDLKMKKIKRRKILRRR